VILARAGGDGDAAESARRADRARYRAKALGRNRTARAGTPVA